MATKPTAAPALKTTQPAPPWLVGFWRGIGHSLAVTLIGSAVVEFTGGNFNLRDIAVPLLVLVQRTLEGVKDGKS